MREPFGMSKQEIAERISLLRVSVKEDKKRVAEELVEYKAAAKALKKAQNNLEAAERAYDKRDSERNARILDRANEAHNNASERYDELNNSVTALVETVHKDYIAISDLLDGRRSDKVMDEYERYNDSVMARIMNIQAYTDTVDAYNLDDGDEEEDDFAMAIPAIPVINGAPAPAPTAAPTAAPAPQAAPAPAMPAYPYPQYIPMPMPYPTYAPATQAAQAAPAPEAAQPKIAPVSIDVSPMLEKALEATMQKFTAAFDKKIEQFLADHPVNIPVGTAPAAPAGELSYGVKEIAALEGLILDDEQALIDKLTAMIETLKTLASGMAQLSALCAEISEKQGAANDMQKQTNDMQRQTMRDQKGIQVSQRVIGQDQAAIAHDQTLLQEQQKTLAENQQALVEAQQAMEETQRLVAENQATLEEAMKDAMQVQKDMIGAQQAIIAGNAKNIEAQGDLVEKQNATLALQKEALVAQKATFREQKALVEKQKTAFEPKKAKAAKEGSEPVAEATVEAEA